MGVITETLSKEIIVKKLRETGANNDIKRIKIIGCGICANLSCSISQGQNQPMTDLLQRPIALKKEMDKLSIHLKEEFPDVTNDYVNGLCVYTKKSDDKIQKMAQDADAIVVMSCPGGLKTVENIVTKDKVVVSGMKVKGFESVAIKRIGFEMYPILHYK